MGYEFIKFDYTAEEATQLNMDDRFSLFKIVSMAVKSAGVTFPQFMPQGASSEFILECIDRGLKISDKTRQRKSIDDVRMRSIEEESERAVPISYEGQWAAWFGLGMWSFEREYQNYEEMSQRSSNYGDKEEIAGIDLYYVAFAIISDVIINIKDYEEYTMSLE